MRFCQTAPINFRGLRILSLTMAMGLASALGPSNAEAAFKVVGYFPTWAGDVNALPYTKLTHINYAFVLPESNGALKPLDGGASRLQTLVQKAHAAGVKVIISVGGWNDGNDSAFVSLAANSSYRNTFVNNLVKFVDQYQLDGVDIDWEYPNAGSEATNFRLLMQQLAATFHPRGKLVTAAVTADDSVGSVDAEVIKAVDFLNLMVYDMGYPHSTYQHAQNALNYWQYNEGLPKDKRVLGLPFYSHKDWVSYKDVIARFGASAAQIDNAGGLDYNGQPTIRAKSELALNQAGGLMFWELSQDTRDSTSLLSTLWDVVGDTVKAGNGTSTGSGTGSGSAPGSTAYSDWQAGKSYAVGDIVRYNGSLYIAVNANPGYDPVISYWYWDPYSPPNDTGSGSSSQPAAQSIPGAWEAEDYVSFNDTTSGNSGGAYRQDAVDIEASTQQGYNIGWIQAGEWLEYEVKVAQAGTYKAEVLVSSQSAGGQMHFSANGQSLGNLSIPVTGSWQTWQWRSVNLNLPAGSYRLRVTMDTAAFNLNALRFSTVTINDGLPAPGRYVIKAVHSGKCLDIDASSLLDDGNVQQYTCNGTGAQAFDLKLENGNYHLVNANSGKGLAVLGSGLGDGVNIHQWTVYNLDNQRFSLIAKGNGQFEIRSKVSGKCVDVVGQYTTDRANVQQWTCNNQSNQRWTFTPSTWNGSNGGNGGTTNSSPTALTKQKILSYLNSISGKQTLVGICSCPQS